MVSHNSVFSQVVRGAGVGRGPVIGAGGDAILGSHRGVDLRILTGTAIKAVASGTVVFAGTRNQDYGNLVVLQHQLSGGEVVYSLYAHMNVLPLAGR